MVPVKQKQGILKQFLMALIVASISLSSIAQTDRVNLPELGNSASDVLSNAEEREYAASLVRQMRAYELLVEDPLITVRPDRDAVSKTRGRTREHVQARTALRIPIRGQRAVQ